MYLVLVFFNSMVVILNLILMIVEILIYFGYVIKYIYRFIFKY